MPFNFSNKRGSQGVMLLSQCRPILKIHLYIPILMYANSIAHPVINILAICYCFTGKLIEKMKSLVVVITLWILLTIISKLILSIYW